MQRRKQSNFEKFKRFKKLFPGIFFVVGFLFLLYYIFLSNLPGGKHFGVTFSGILSLWFFLCGLLQSLKKNNRLPAPLEKAFRLGGYLFSIWLISFFLFCGLIYFPSNQKELPDPDYLVILGAGLNGETPSLTLYKRLTAGLNYLQQHPDLPVVVTGGQGPGESIPEAQAMEKFLLANGISKERILTEDKATSTMENFVYTSELLQKKGAWQPLKINLVTNDFHVFRSKMLAERNGFITGSISAPTPYYLLPSCLVREYFALVKSFIFDRSPVQSGKHQA